MTHLQSKNNTATIPMTDISSMTNEQENQLLQIAIQRHQSGHIEQAVEYYQQVLTINSDNINALHQLSRIAYSLNDYSAAESLILKAIQLNRKISVFHKHLGDIYAKQNAETKAKYCYKKAIKLTASDFDAHNNLGLIYHSEKNYLKAINCFKKAIHHNKQFAIAWNNYGVSLSKINHTKTAESAFKQACQCDEKFAEPYFNLGNHYLDTNNLAQAEQHYQNAINLNPMHYAAHNNLGCLYLLQNQDHLALEQFEESIKINPQHFDALRNAASIYISRGEFEKGIHHLMSALNINNQDPQALTEFSKIVVQINITANHDALKQLINNCFTMDSIDHQRLARASAKLICEQFQINTNTLQEPASIPMLIEALAQDMLFQQLMTNTVNEDNIIEKLIYNTRQYLSKQFQIKSSITQNEQLIATLIALQLFNNEYILTISEQEQTLMDAIETVQEYNHRPVERLLVLAMYKPANTINNAHALLSKLSKKEKSQLLNKFYHHCIVNPQIEEKIRKQIPGFGLNNNDVTLRVRQQYEENPYPRWTSLDKPANITPASHFQKIFPHLETPDFLNNTIDILVAGCGTGKHPITLALKYPHAKITAIDLSLSSLAYAKRMADYYLCNNINFMQGDLLEINKLSSKFHIIESAGVLHHLNDPLLGWERLLDCLHDDGIMKISLYSEMARSSVIKARKCIEKMQLSTSEKNDIRFFRTYILDHPESPELTSLTQLCDFHSLSGCRDLLFHQQEHRFTLPQLKSVLNELQLDFLGFEFNEPNIKQQYIKCFPEDPSYTNLLTWHQFEQENMTTFLRMYQFYVKKQGCSQPLKKSIKTGY